MMMIRWFHIIIIIIMRCSDSERGRSFSTSPEAGGSGTLRSGTAPRADILVMGLGAGMTKAQYLFALMIIFACAALPSHLKRQPNQLVHAVHLRRVAVPVQLSTAPCDVCAGTSG